MRRRTGGSTFDPTEGFCLFVAGMARNNGDYFVKEQTKARATAGSTYDPDEGFIYFLAGNALDPSHISAPAHRYSLMAVTDVDSGNGVLELEGRLRYGHKLLLDSGIFWLTQRHAKAHGVHMDEALGLHPSQIDGFDWLYETYCELVTKYEDKLWGYIELDQGGAERKRETRARLEADGFRPIPVYHPLNDGWDYFDELCQGYDRICVGNIVQAPPAVRKRIIATIWERRRAYPDVWIHLLGFTPNEFVTAYPACNSCDSSSWVYSLRYGAPSAPGASAMGKAFGRFTAGFSYVTGEGSSAPEHPAGVYRAIEFLSMEAHFQHGAWRQAWQDRAELFDLDPWPPRVKGEELPVPARPA